MEDNVNSVQIAALKDDIKDLRDQLQRFIGSHDEQMKGLTLTLSQKDDTYSKTYTRNDVLAFQLKNIEETTKATLQKLNENGKEIGDLQKYLPMLDMIRKEREHIKYKVVDAAGKFVLWVIGIALSVLAIKKIGS